MHRASGIGDGRENVVQMLAVHFGNGIFTELVVSYCADGHCVYAELPGMIGKVYRGASYLSSFGQHVPENFAQSYY